MKIDKTITFRKWIKNRKSSKKELKGYVNGLGEWYQSEFKVTSNQDGSNIRKAVSSMANKHGGEVLIGISDKGKIAGTTITSQQITQVLQQQNAPKGDWYLTDLNEVVKHNTSVQFKIKGKVVSVFVLEVKSPGMPVFVYEGNKFEMYIRIGESSVLAHAFQALSWKNEVSRETILRTLFLEFRTLMKRISGGFPEITLGLGLSFPYLEKMMQDGTLYQYLTPDDLKIILGESRGTGYTGGLYNAVFRLRSNIERLFREQQASKNPHFHEELRQYFSGISIESEIASFGNFLEGEGIYIDDE